MLSRVSNSFFFFGYVNKWIGVAKFILQKSCFFFLGDKKEKPKRHISLQNMKKQNKTKQNKNKCYPKD